ncbi:hypothetical protein CSTAT_12795 [Corynebacterium stationis]|uniref:TIGR04255 family protein n=1 Tax=Corynebacterium stationis TaxID=1705 RepID=UPI0009508E1A|nr:TIGR04255 family protein [Corynebacterium stationis]APT96099.1 hypothetical protein CSTAT_12795 [Corynebacterium stationis]
METKNVYPNAPIVLVALEIDLETDEALTLQAVNLISGRLKNRLPERAELPGYSVSFNVAEEAEPDLDKVVSWRWSSRDKRTHFSIRQAPHPVDRGIDVSLSFELTDYAGYENLRELVKNSVAAVMETLSVRVVNRVGLRYLDEIRVPSPSEGDSIVWSDWVKDSLVREIDEVSSLILDGGVKQNSVAYQIAEDTFLHMRYGALEGFAFTGSDDFRRELPTPGPFFLLDLAIEKTVGTNSDLDSLLEIIDRAHEPIREIFELLITDKLRQEVLNNEY